MDNAHYIYGDYRKDVCYHHITIHWIISDNSFIIIKDYVKTTDYLEEETPFIE